MRRTLQRNCRAHSPLATSIFILLSALIVNRVVYLDLFHILHGVAMLIHWTNDRPTTNPQRKHVTKTWAMKYYLAIHSVLWRRALQAFQALRGSLLPGFVGGSGPEGPCVVIHLKCIPHLQAIWCILNPRIILCDNLSMSVSPFTPLNWEYSTTTPNGLS